MARARRSRSGRSSSTKSRVLSSLIRFFSWSAYGRRGAFSTLFLRRQIIDACDSGRKSPKAPLTRLGLGWRPGPINHAPGPADRNQGPAIGRIFRINQASGLLQQDLGNEKAQAHAFMLIQGALWPDISLDQGVTAGTRRDVGLTQGLENLGRKAGDGIRH